MRPVYPWSAVVGQESLKHALLLCAIDPAIGGVLVQGPRGVAKTTLARALGQLVSGRFVELPLGASEERVTGSLDLQRALRDAEVAFSPGLLARAHEGVLYVDEVNLLPDALVDLLLDAAASGFNTVERDGISHTHPSRFVLVGTMNPDEGELRPQLTDRFGLSVRAQGQLSAAERAEIVRRRLAFDADPLDFSARFAADQRALAERCRAARERVREIPLAGEAVELVSARCQRANVEGVRGDLAMLRAARAHAAWHGRAHMGAEDIEAVAELALAHRRRSASEPPSSGPGGGTAPSSGASRSSDMGGRARDASAHSSAANAAPPAIEASPSAGRPSDRSKLAPPGRSANGEPRGDARGDDAGAFRPLAPVPVRSGPRPRLPSSLLAPLGRRSEARRRGAARRVGVRGARGRAHATGCSIDWFATFAVTRRPGFEDLRYRQRRAPSAELLVLALDCSSSMLRSGALARAKAVVQACEAQALRTGARVALVSFRGSGAKLELDTRESRPTRKHVIEQLGGGGGTPLRSALEQAFALCKERSFARAEVGRRVIVLTDGRTREQVSDLAWGARTIELMLVDCESGPVRIGRARALADDLGARCVRLDQLSAEG